MPIVTGVGLFCHDTITPMHKRHGFTIVELLIVIVVIAILAAITIVAYNGIQSRAKNTQQLSVARGYLSAFASYVAANGTYPVGGGQSRICLGIDVAACTTATTSWYRDTTLENNLKTLMSTLPVANPSIQIVSSPKMGYVPASDVTLDGVPTPFLIYSLLSGGTCTAGTPASGTWPAYSSTPPAQGYTSIEAGLRMCFIPMPPA